MGSGKILYHLGTTDGRVSRTVGAAGAKVCLQSRHVRALTTVASGLFVVLIGVGTFLGAAQSKHTRIRQPGDTSAPSALNGKFACGDILHVPFPVSS